jgi:hypothetical protein
MSFRSRLERRSARAGVRNQYWIIVDVDNVLGIRYGGGRRLWRNFHLRSNWHGGRRRLELLLPRLVSGHLAA